MLRAYEAARQDVGETPFSGLDAIAALSATDYLRTRTEDYGGESWRSMYRHRTLVHLVLLNLWDTEAGPPRLAEWFVRVYQRDMDFFRVSVAPTHPEMAKELAETMQEVRRWLKISELVLSVSLPQ